VSLTAGLVVLENRKILASGGTRTTFPRPSSP